MTLRQIANTTRIAVSALDAIERDDVKKLPGGIFARSFVRAYASELKLDVEQTVTDFFAQFPEPVDACGAGDRPVRWRLGVSLPAGSLRGGGAGDPALALVGWMVFGGRGATPDESRPRPARAFRLRDRTCRRLRPHVPSPTSCLPVARCRGAPRRRPPR